MKQENSAKNQLKRLRVKISALYNLPRFFKQGRLWFLQLAASTGFESVIFKSRVYASSTLKRRSQVLVSAFFNIRLFDLMLDLIDIYIEVLHIDYDKLGSNGVGKSSVSIQERE